MGKVKDSIDFSAILWCQACSKPFYAKDVQQATMCLCDDCMELAAERAEERKYENG